MFSHKKPLLLLQPTYVSNKWSLPAETGNPRHNNGWVIDSIPTYKFFYIYIAEHISKVKCTNLIPVEYIHILMIILQYNTSFLNYTLLEYYVIYFLVIVVSMKRKNYIFIYIK